MFTNTGFHPVIINNGAFYESLSALGGEYHPPKTPYLKTMLDQVNHIAVYEIVDTADIIHIVCSKLNVNKAAFLTMNTKLRQIFICNQLYGIPSIETTNKESFSAAEIEERLQKIPELPPLPNSSAADIKELFRNIKALYHTPDILSIYLRSVAMISVAQHFLARGQLPPWFEWGPSTSEIYLLLEIIVQRFQQQNTQLQQLYVRSTPTLTPPTQREPRENFDNYHKYSALQQLDILAQKIVDAVASSQLPETIHLIFNDFDDSMLCKKTQTFIGGNIKLWEQYIDSLRARPGVVPILMTSRSPILGQQDIIVKASKLFNNLDIFLSGTVSKVDAINYLCKKINKLNPKIKIASRLLFDDDPGEHLQAEQTDTSCFQMNPDDYKEVATAEEFNQHKFVQFAHAYIDEHTPAVDMVSTVMKQMLTQVEYTLFPRQQLPYTPAPDNIPISAPAQ